MLHFRVPRRSRPEDHPQVVPLHTTALGCDIIPDMSITLSKQVKVLGLPTSDEWKVVIHPAKEGGFWGEVPALHGCASFGSTRAECRANVREAAIGCLEVYFEEALKSFSSARKGGRRRVLA